MKMTMTTASTVAPRMHRKVLRVAQKRLNHLRLQSAGKGRTSAAAAAAIRSAQHNSSSGLDPCENSNDSGLGFDHHIEYQLAARGGVISRNRSWQDEREITDVKRRKFDIKLESDETNDDYIFPDNIDCKGTTSLIRTAPASVIPNLSRTSGHSASPARAVPRCLPLTDRRSPTGPITLTTQLGNICRSGKTQLQIICQPEQQHRARYQTEGSRGAVKDRTGNGFPVVKLVGYDKPATLQIFIGTDIGRVAPHMFYQACRVSGKNSTPCVEKKIEGTIVIEVELDPSKDMVVTCDCVGILKERNVDVEHRFPEQSGPRSKKKSTRCRMVFRTTITHDNGSTETLQTCSQPIVCTQPPGVPEICKKSLSVSSTTGGAELFILGKNFLKDTRVVFQHCRIENTSEKREILWEETVVPDKEFLQQTHLVCVVPAYARHDLADPVTVSLFVVSSGKTSEPHPFMYTPTPPSTSASGKIAADSCSNIVADVELSMVLHVETNSANERIKNLNGHLFRTHVHRIDQISANGFAPVEILYSVPPVPYLAPREDVRPVMLWQSVPEVTPKSERLDIGMMPPPTSLMPLSQRRPSASMGLIVPETLKTELMDESSQSSDMSAARYNENSLDVHVGDSNITSLSENSMDAGVLRRSNIPIGMLHQDNSAMTNMINDNSREAALARSISMTMVNENSMDADMSRRVTLRNENGMDVGMSRRGSMSVVHHSEDANMSHINENSMDAMNVRRGGNSVETVNRSTVSCFGQTAALLSENASALLPTDEMKGIDLRMKGPIGTLSDLASTQSPSLATLRRFGVTEQSNIPLPTQSAQSIENYLTTLENAKNPMNPSISTSASSHMQADKSLTPAQKLDVAVALMQVNTSSSVFGEQDNALERVSARELLAGLQRDQSQPGTMTNASNTSKALYSDQDLSTPQSIANDILASTNLSNSNTFQPVLMNSQLACFPSLDNRSVDSNITNTESQSFSNMTIMLQSQSAASDVAKTNASAVFPVLGTNELTITDRLMSQAEAQRSSLVLQTATLQSATTVKQLDAFVNSAAETHMGSPPMNTTDLADNVSSVDQRSPLNQQSPPRRSPSQQELVMHSQSSDVMINTQAPVINQQSVSEIMSGSQQNSATQLKAITNSQTSSNVLSPEIILNPQVSPSLMCRNNTPQETLLLSPHANPMCQSISGHSMQLTTLQPTVTQQEQQLLSPAHRVSPVAVKNMILNAAAEILESQPTSSAQQTLQSLLQAQPTNSENVMNVAQQINKNVYVSNQTNSTADAGQSIGDQRIPDLIKMENQQQTGYLGDSRYSGTPSVNQSASSKSPDSNSERNAYIGQAISAANDAKPIIPVPVKEMTSSSTASSNASANATTPVKEGLLTQEITTMSDTDLLSYINPSCFDQV